MLSIDPERVGDAVVTLRVAVDNADEVDGDALVASRICEIQLPSLLFVRDLEDDLTLLSAVLATRAAQALGYRVDGAGLVGAMDSLLSSVQVEGDLAIYDAIADGTISDAEWATISAAGHNLVGLSQTSTMEEFQAYLSKNEELRIIEPMLLEVAMDSGVTGMTGELRDDLLERFPDQEDLILRVLPYTTEAMYGYDRDYDRTLTITADYLLGQMIERGVFTHSPKDAYDFIMSFPNVENREDGFDMFAVGPQAVETIHKTAEKITISLRERYDLGVQLPETYDGYRNWVITTIYAEIGLELNSLARIDNNYNWSMIASDAALSARGAIDGSERILHFFGNTHLMRQSFADGNQRIVMSVMPKYLDLLELYENGEPTEADVTGFLRTFDDGEADLRKAFQLQILALGSENREEALLYQFTSNLKLGIHEQTLIESDLDFGQMMLLEQIGMRFLSTIDSVIPNPKSFDPRSAGQYMADEGTLKVPLADGSVYEIPLDHIEDSDLIPESLRGLTLSDLDMSNEIPGLPSITTAAEELGVDLEIDKWHDDITGSIELDDWTRFSDRIGPIATIFLLLQTDPRLLESVHVLAKSDPPHRED